MTTPDKDEMPTDRTATYSEGISGDGAAVLRDGQPVAISEVIDLLNAIDTRAQRERRWDEVNRKSSAHSPQQGLATTMTAEAEASRVHGNVAKSEGSDRSAAALICSPSFALRSPTSACNAYEPMREALILAEKADRIHSKCQECEDGAQAPEACGDCFPSADDARIARRNVLKSLGVRMRDVDRARVVKAEPSICNCSQEDVHDYGPCGEHCRSQLATDPHDEDLSRLKDALQLADGAFESIRKKLVNNLDEPERSAFWAAVNARDSIRAALSTLPVNDRHHSGSDSYQADASAPALSENVNGAEGWQPEGSENLMALLDAIQRLEKELPGWWWSVGSCHVSADASIGPINRPWTHASIGPDSAGRDAHLLEDKLFDGGFHCDLRQPATCAESLNQAIDEALAARRDAELNFSNEAERDGVSLKTDTSSQPASEAGKLSQ